MPQPPNLQNMLRQAQEMMAQQQQAQEALKAEKVEASTGGGMVKVTMTGDLHLKSIVLEPCSDSRSSSTPTPSTPRTSRCCRTSSSPPSTRRFARPGATGVQARRPGRGV